MLGDKWIEDARTGVIEHRSVHQSVSKSTRDEEGARDSGTYESLKSIEEYLGDKLGGTNNSTIQLIDKHPLFSYCSQ